MKRIIYTLSAFILWATMPDGVMISQVTTSQSAASLVGATAHDVLLFSPSSSGDSATQRLYRYASPGLSVKMSYAVGGNLKMGSTRQEDIVAADFDGDGFDEIAALWAGSDAYVNLMVSPMDFLRTGWPSGEAFVSSGGIGRIAVRGAQPCNVHIVAGNFDGSESKELLLAYWSESGPVVLKIFKIIRDPNGRLDTQRVSENSSVVVSLSLEESAHFDVVTGDFDGDGKDEIAMIFTQLVSSTDWRVRVRFFDVTAAGIIPKGSRDLRTVNPAHNDLGEGTDYEHVVITAGDFNGDGRDEVVAGYQVRRSWWWYCGLFCNWWHFLTNSTCAIYALQASADLNTVTQRGSVSWNSGDIDWLSLIAYRSYVRYPGYSMGMTSADLDLDRRSEVLWHRWGSLLLYRMNDTLGFVPVTGATQSYSDKRDDPSSNSLCVADLDTLGYPDDLPEVVVGDWANSGRLRVLRVQRSGGVVSSFGNGGVLTNVPFNGRICLTTGGFIGGLFYTPAPLKASYDGAEGRLNLNWSDNSYIETGYRIYRDGIHRLPDADPNETMWTDDGPETPPAPGVIYKYGVAAVFAGDIESPRASDLGRIPDDGVIRGTVKTIHNVGVPNVEISVDSTSPNRYKSLSLNGSTAYAEAPDDAAFDAGDTYTIEAWVYPRSFLLNAGVVSKYQPSSNAGFFLALGNSGKVRFDGMESVNDVLTANSWNHLAAVNSGGIRRLYVNGVEQALAGSAIADMTNDLPVTIGRLGSAFFDGYIDEVRFWNIARTPGDIVGSMGTYLSGNETGLKAYWRFDEGRDTICNDFSAEANYAVIKSGATFSDIISPPRIVSETNGAGNFTLENINYGRNYGEFTSTWFHLRAYKESHNITPVDSTAVLSQTSTMGDASFTDLSSFSASGVVKFAGTNCPIDSVEILVDGVPGGYTHDGGLFSAAVDIGVHTLRMSYQGHAFAPDSLQKSFFGDTSGIVFLDVETHAVSGRVASGTCEYPLGRAVLDILDTTGCVSIEDTTDDQGAYSISLPATNYLLKVTHLIPNNLDAVEFFKSQAYSVSLLDADQTLNLLYRTPPSISISGIPAVGTCPSTIVRQGHPFPVDIRVMERFGSELCLLDSGFVEVADDVGDVDTIARVPIVNGKATYILRPGVPNILAGGANPYQKKLEVKVTTPGGSKVTTKWMIVTGVRPRERTFTTVTPNIPFLILRDPPGDGSFSFIDQSKSTCQSLSLSCQTDRSLNLWAEAKIGAGVQLPWWGGTGGYVDLTGGVELGVSNSVDNEVEICTRTNSRYQTSAQEDLIGHRADVYVGGAINLLYAICDIMDFDPSTCQPTFSKSVAVGSSGFATTFGYTESYITDVLMPELKTLADIYTAKHRLDSASLYADQLEVWQQVIDRNARLKESAQFDTNMSFSGGFYHEYSEAVTETKSTSLEFNTYVNTELATEFGLNVQEGYLEFRGGVKMRFSLNLGGSTKSVHQTTSTVGYAFADNDPSDGFTVDVKKDAVYGTPVFDLVGGKSSCPWEESTLPREGVAISISPTARYDVPADSPAVFTLTLGNTSQTPEARTYRLRIDHSSNPLGATIRINGVEVPDGMNFQIGPNAQVNATVAVSKGPTSTNFENLQLIFESLCDDSISKKIAFSAFFDDGVDDPPTLYSRMIVTAKNTPVDFELRAMDPEGKEVTYTIIAQADHGTVTGTPPDLTYHPNPNFAGIDSFYFAAADGHSATRGTMKFNVQNSPPSVSPAYAVSTAEDSAIGIQLEATDADGDSLTYSILESPTNGGISGTTPMITYTPRANFYGTDMFRFSVSDGIATSEASCVLTVAPVNDPPIAVDDQASLNLGESRIVIPVLQNDINVDNDTLRITDSLLVGASGVGLVNEDGTVTYVPDSSALVHQLHAMTSRTAGFDTLTYTVSDGVFSSQGKIIINLNPSNNRPIAGFGHALSFDGSNDWVQTGMNTQLKRWTIEAWVNSPTAPSGAGSSAIIWRGKNFQINWNHTNEARRAAAVVEVGGIVSTASFGTLLAGRWYDLAASYDGNALRSYVDGSLVSVNDTVLGDPDADSVDVCVGSEGASGGFFEGLIDDVRIWNRARADSEIGRDFSVVLTGSEAGLVAYWRFDENHGDTTTDATPSHQPAVMMNMTNPWVEGDHLIQYATDEDVSVSIPLFGYDLDGDSLSFHLLSQPVYGTLIGSAPGLTYTPDRNINGYEYLAYEVDDGTSASDTKAVVAINVKPVNDPPVARPVTITVNKNRSSLVVLAGSDPDNDLLRYTLGSPLFGGLSSTDTIPWIVSYTPNPNFAGVDSFQYWVYDQVDSASAHVRLTVYNTPPQAESQNHFTTIGVACAFQLSGSDEDGDTLDFSILEPPLHGTGVQQADTVRYLPNSGFVGLDSLVFAVSDGIDSDTGVARISVLSPLSVQKTMELPKEYKLYQNYPNPFNPLTVFTFDLPKRSNVQLDIYNILGQLVERVFDEQRDAGTITVRWNAARFASGVYFYRLVAQETVQPRGFYISTKKMILIK